MKLYSLFINRIAGIYRRFEESRRNELEKMSRSPRRWWETKKLGMTGGRERSGIGKVYDEASVVRQGERSC